MDIIEKSIRDEIAFLKSSIKDLEKELEDLENATVWGKTYVLEYNSDLGMNFPKEVDGIVPMSNNEKMRNKKIIQDEIYNIKNRISEKYLELDKIEQSKPENVSKEKEKIAKQEYKERIEAFNKKYKEHLDEFEDQMKLVEYLRLAKLYDLSDELERMRFAFEGRSSHYLNDEVKLLAEDEEISNGITVSKKQYKQIRKDVIRLSKIATKIAKKYKGLLSLWENAGAIVMDIEDKKLSTREELESYFLNHVNYLFKGESLGYEYLGFYRDPNSSFNDYLRTRRI